MIGQDYFDLRSRLGSALFALRGLAGEDAADAPQSAILEKLAGGLREPFVFIVVGEVNVGKSTLLNALFGADLTQTGVMPTTGRILYFKHGKTARRLAVTRTLEEVHAPVDFLKDFHIVDTPGTNSIEGEHQAVTERFVPLADLVIFVFSAMNPWGASAWRFLEKVHDQWMRKIVFVLQQSDLREPEEIRSILAYMQRLCLQRFGREFPIYPVAAKKAYLARSSGIDCERLLAESGMLHLEQHLSRALSGGEARLAKLAAALQSGRGILSAIDAQIASREAELENWERILRVIEEDLAGREQRTSAELAHAVEAEEADFRHASHGVMAAVAARLTPREALCSVFRSAHPFAGLEANLINRLGELGADRWERAMAVVEQDACVAARWLGQQLAEAMLTGPQAEAEPDPGAWPARRHSFMAAVDGVRERVVAALELEELLEPAQASSRRLARGQVFSAAAAALAGAGLAAAGWWTMAIPAAAAAALLFFIIGAVNARRLSRAAKECDSRLAGAASEVRRQVEAQLRAEIRGAYERCGGALRAVRGTLAARTQRHGAVRQQAANLARTFDGLDAELRVGPVTAR